MTSREINAYARGVARAELRQFRRSMATAWQAVAWYVRVRNRKRLPDLSRYLDRLDPQERADRPAKSPKSLMTMAAAISTALGGNVPGGFRFKWKKPPAE